MMSRLRAKLDPWTVALLIVAGAILILGAMSLSTAPKTVAETESHGEEGKVEQVAGTELSRVTLTEHAARRLDIQTSPVRAVQAAGKQRTAVSYAAVLYDPHGQTWVYTNPEPLVYVRQRIDVESISGDQAMLSDGPPAGTAVVTVGAAELYGTELGVGH
jgi:hypothetical protein